MGKIVTLKSGAELDMTMGSFEEGKRLMKAVVKEVGTINIKASDDHVNMFKDILARAILSDDIEAALKPCLERITYKKCKWSMDLFEDEKNREDYLLVLKEVLEYNLTPFFVNLISLLKDLQEKVKTARK